jgi:hypothetical protein
MPRSRASSWVFGALAVVLAHLLWVGLVLGQAQAGWLMGAIIAMFFVTLNSAGLGAFVTARLAPDHGFLLGLGHAPLAAALAVGANLAVRLAGVRIDLAGFRGMAGLFAVTLAYGIFASTVGGLIGWWTRRQPAGEAAPVRRDPFISDPIAGGGPLDTPPS